MEKYHQPYNYSIDPLFILLFQSFYKNNSIFSFIITNTKISISTNRFENMSQHNYNDMQRRFNQLKSETESETRHIMLAKTIVQLNTELNEGNNLNLVELSEKPGTDLYFIKNINIISPEKSKNKSEESILGLFYQMLKIRYYTIDILVKETRDERIRYISPDFLNNQMRFILSFQHFLNDKRFYDRIFSDKIAFYNNQDYIKTITNETLKKLHIIFGNIIYSHILDMNTINDLNNLYRHIESNPNQMFFCIDNIKDEGEDVYVGVMANNSIFAKSIIPATPFSYYPPMPNPANIPAAEPVRPLDALTASGQKYNIHPYSVDNEYYIFEPNEDFLGFQNTKSLNSILSSFYRMLKTIINSFEEKDEDIIGYIDEQFDAINQIIKEGEPMDEMKKMDEIKFEKILDDEKTFVDTMSTFINTYRDNIKYSDNENFKDDKFVNSKGKEKRVQAVSMLYFLAKIFPELIETQIMIDENFFKKKTKYR
jgi:hypothetical protein